MTYPDDVMRAAEQIANEAIRTSFQDPLMPMVVHLKPAIARAIMAERERAQGAPASGPGSCPAGRTPAGSDASRGDPSRAAGTGEDLL